MTPSAIKTNSLGEACRDITSLKKYCFYLDIKNNATSQALSKKIRALGLREEASVSSSTSHVVREAACGRQWQRQRQAGGTGAGTGSPLGGRAEAMLRQLATPPPPAVSPRPHYLVLSVNKALQLLDDIYEKFFASQNIVKHFKGNFIKVEFLDSVCKPLVKEFEEWPSLVREVTPPSTPAHPANNNNTNNTDKMTKRNRPRVKGAEAKGAIDAKGTLDPKGALDSKSAKAAAGGGYCEMCARWYAELGAHRRSAQHAAFVRERHNFLELDALLSSERDVRAYLEPSHERRSLRKLCNGDSEAVNGATSPTNGPEDKKRKSKTPKQDDKQYYKVVGVSTKLRSSGGFQQKPTPPCNGDLVVKFRKVRRSELSVLSDEAEQFMFPRRPSSSSTEDSDSEDTKPPTPLPDRRRVKTPQPSPRATRPTALKAKQSFKEESSEEDTWLEDLRKRKKKAPVNVRKTKVPRLSSKPKPKTPSPEPTPEVQVEPAKEEEKQRCLKWEDGRLKATPEVEQLEFAFESVPSSEPWFDTFKRQDEGQIVTKNIPQLFELYMKHPKLPYEIGQLPPLKPNCCPLSDLVKKEGKGLSRSYGTRGMKKQKIRKRTAAALLALEAHPRKSPREHASTLAILGSAGILNRKKHIDDAKSTASEDTTSCNSNTKSEPQVNDVNETSERLQQFLSEVFTDAEDIELVDDDESDIAIDTSLRPDIINLVSECDSCDIIQSEARDSTLITKSGRRGYKFKKKNKTGWPNNKKKTRKSDSTNGSIDNDETTPDRDNSIEPAESIDYKSDISIEEKPKKELDNSTEEKPKKELDTSPEDKPKKESKQGKKSRKKNCSLLDEKYMLLPVVRVAKIDEMSRILRSTKKEVTKKKSSRAYQFR